MNIPFPKRVINNLSSYEFLLNLNLILKVTNKENIIFDLTNTKTFNTSLLAVLNCIIDGCNKSIILILPKGKKYPKEKIAISIFNYYSKDKRSFYKPRMVVGNLNVRETEDLLLKYLKKLKLQDYDKIKVLLSEIIANIKMHVADEKSLARGYIAAFYDIKRNIICVSIINNHKTILEKLKEESLEFNSDKEAIIWALKKHNTTRTSSESGGIGLYLLRRYTSELNANTTIISGNAYIEISESNYDEKNENTIVLSNSKTTQNKFNGTIITIEFPYVIKSMISDKNTELSILNIMEV